MSAANRLLRSAIAAAAAAAAGLLIKSMVNAVSAPDDVGDAGYRPTSAT